MTEVEPSTLATSMANPIARFETYQEANDVEEYSEQLELFFEVQKVANDSKVAQYQKFEVMGLLIKNEIDIQCCIGNTVFL